MIVLEIIGAVVVSALIALGATKYLERRDHQLNRKRK